MKNESLIELANSLIGGVVLKRTNPFQTINIVVPSTSTAIWFKTYWLKTQSKVLMNVNFINENDYLLSVLNKSRGTNFNLVDKTFLVSILYRLFILDEWKQYLSNIEKINDHNNLNDLSKSIEEYLKGGNQNAIDLSNIIADIFLDYDIDYNTNDYEKDPITKLYNDVFELIEKNYHLTTLNRIFNNYEAKNALEKGENTYFFGFQKFAQILKVFKNVDEFAYVINEPKKFRDDNKDFIQAPSKKREIERLHSKVCEILKDTNNTCSDILVLAPSISDYQKEIEVVFKQDGKNFVNIPFTICCKNNKTSESAMILEILYDIYAKRFFSVNDFMSLLYIPLFAKIRGIDDEELEVIKSTLAKTNTCRNKPVDDKKDLNAVRNDWELLRRRLLLSRIGQDECNLDEYIQLRDKGYLPYSAIGLDNKTITDIASLIDDLFEWMFHDQTIASYDDLNTLLHKFLSEADEDNKEYIKIKHVINVGRVAYNKDHFDDKALFLIHSLIKDFIKRTSTISSGIFSKGITFANLNFSSVLNAKHIFVLGCDSNSLSKIICQSELDKRSQDIIKCKLDNKISSFICQCNNCENLHVSYVYLNLKEDKEIGYSGYLLGLHLFDDIEKAEKIPLDETREYSQLFTKSSFTKKDLLLGVKIQGSNSKRNDVGGTVIQRPQKVTINNMRDFLRDTFSSKVNSILDVKDYNNDIIVKNVEKTIFDALDQSNILEELVSFKIKQDFNKINDKVYNYLRMKNVIPTHVDYLGIDGLSKSIYDKQCEQIDDLLSQAKDNLGVSISEHHLYPKKDFHIVNVIGNDRFDFVISYSGSKILYNENVDMVDVNLLKGKIDDEKDFEHIILGLCIVAEKNNLEKSYTIKYNTSSGTGSFQISPINARNKLTYIYKLMTDYTLFEVVLACFLNGSGKADTFNAFKNKVIGMHSAWEHFKYQKLFDVFHDLGVLPANFQNEYSKILDKYKDISIWFNKEVNDGI